MPNQQATPLSLTKESILDTAEQVLRRYGEKTAVIDVARALQVSHGTVYRHFSSKASLREAVTERWLQRIAAPLQTIAAESGGSTAERLRLWFETLVGSKRSSAVNDPELFGLYTKVTGEAVEMITGHVNSLLQQIAEIIEEGMRSQEFKAGRAEEIAKAIFMATSRFHHPAHAYEWSSATIDLEFDMVWDLVLAGISQPH